MLISMDSLLSGIIGAIIGAVGAVVSVYLAEHIRSKDESKKLKTALKAELDLNQNIAKEILQQNRNINSNARDNNHWQWCEIIQFSETAWNAVISTGKLSYLDEKMIEPLANAFMMVKRANFIAGKIMAGKFHPIEGQKYTERVKIADESIGQALEVMGK
jgi:gas vesicle protein